MKHTGLLFIKILYLDSISVKLGNHVAVNCQTISIPYGSISVVIRATHGQHNEVIMWPINTRKIKPTIVSSGIVSPPSGSCSSFAVRLSNTVITRNINHVTCTSPRDLQYELYVGNLPDHCQ